MKLALAVFLGWLLAWPGAGSAKEGCGPGPCQSVEVDLHDREALQRGARTYVNYCLGCHALGYMRYERLADDLGIPHDLAVAHLMFGNGKIGDLMTTAMDDAQARQWFGVAPPDLTLITRAHSPEWVYTYLNSFYADPERPWGVNNLVVPNVAMPHVLSRLEGLKRCQEYTASGDECLVLGPGEPGRLSTAEFERQLVDLVSFLEYAAEPYALERRRMGVYVLLFLALLAVMTYMLKREYWKQID